MKLTHNFRNIFLIQVLEYYHAIYDVISMNQCIFTSKKMSSFTIFHYNVKITIYINIQIYLLLYKMTRIFDCISRINIGSFNKIVDMFVINLMFMFKIVFFFG